LGEDYAIEAENADQAQLVDEDSQAREMAAALASTTQIRELPPIVTKDLSEKDKIVRVLKSFVSPNFGF
jgi:hypothetical protein